MTPTPLLAHLPSYLPSYSPALMPKHLPEHLPLNSTRRAGLATLARLAGAASLAATGLLFSGCATTVASVSSEVSTFGEWPAGRAPGSYAFERLPSQAAEPAVADAIEAAAKVALAKAGFTPVANGQMPDVLIQVAAHNARTDRYPWDDPLWFRGGFGFYRHGPWGGPGWGAGWVHSRHVDNSRSYLRATALLVRDRVSGKPLFEGRATNDGLVPAEGAVLASMFEASMMDFPKLGLNPRRVTVALPAQGK